MNTHNKNFRFQTGTYVDENFGYDWGARVSHNDVTVFYLIFRLLHDPFSREYDLLPSIVIDFLQQLSLRFRFAQLSIQFTDLRFGELDEAALWTERRKGEIGKSHF